MPIAVGDYGQAKKIKVLVSGNPTDPPETDPTVTFFSPCLLSQKYGNVQFPVPTTDSGDYQLLARIIALSISVVTKRVKSKIENSCLDRRQSIMLSANSWGLHFGKK